MQKYALILFDDDGCTSVVETKKLYGNCPLRQSVHCTLGMTAGPQYTVEILEMSDSKTELNKFENTWSQTHRSLALDEAKQRKGKQTGGYLSIWPEDEQAVSLDVSENSNDQPVTRKTGRTTSQGSNSTVKSGKKQAGKQSKRKASETATPSTADSQSTTNNAIITGTNGRKITVLYEGGGDYNRHGSEPERAPFFTDHLSEDQRDILILQVMEHEKQMRSFSTQTKKVVIMGDDSEVLDLVAKNTGQEDQSACKCSCEKVLKIAQENSAKLNKLTDLITSVKEKLDEKFDSSLISVSLLESFGLPAETGAVEEKVVSRNVSSGTNVTESAASTENVQTEPSAEYVHINQSIPRGTVTAESQDNGESIKEHLSVDISDEVTFRQNQVNFFTASPKSPYLLLDLQSPVQKRCFTSACSKGPIVEVYSSTDIPPGDVEIRIHPEIQRQTRQMSCSLGNFGWLLAKQVFTVDEMAGKNYHGRKGKHSLSPRRVHAIEHAAVDMFGEGENIKFLANAVNTGIRNSRRQPFRPMFQN